MAGCWTPSMWILETAGNVLHATYTEMDWRTESCDDDGGISDKGTADGDGDGRTRASGGWWWCCIVMTWQYGYSGMAMLPLYSGLERQTEGGGAGGGGGPTGTQKCIIALGGSILGVVVCFATTHPLPHTDGRTDATIVMNAWWIHNNRKKHSPRTHRIVGF